MKKEEPKDSLHEGRDEYFVDVDRMISEGLAGGTYSMKYDREYGEEQIEQAREFKREEPPRH